MKRIYILMIAICMLNIANAQQKIHAMPNLGKQAINNPLHGNFPNNVSLKHKSTNPITWNFDTIVAIDSSNTYSYRIIQTFNNYGNVLTLSYESRQNNTWKNNEKYTFTYDKNGNMLTELFEYMQVKVNKTTFTYDANDNRISQFYELRQNNAWVNKSKTTYSYDTNENLLIELEESWQNNAWVNQFKYTYTYDTFGNKITKLNESWQNNAWINYYKYTYIYDVNGNRLTQSLEFMQNNIWVNNSKYTYTYDTNGNKITELNENWHNNAWVNNSKYTLTYSINGNKITELNESWQNNAWVYTSKYTCIYDIKENLQTELEESWIDNAWINNSKNTYSYDANGNSITGKYQIWVNNNWEMTSYDNINVYSSQKEIFGLIATYYDAHFVSFTNGITENNNKQINIYPNPATSKLTINLQQLTKFQNTTVSIYDVQGKLLIQQNITQPQTELNIAAFAKGIYIVKVNNDNNSIISKFVKE